MEFRTRTGKVLDRTCSNLAQSTLIHTRTRSKQAGLGHVFRALCDADAAGELQEWLVSETSLEDVFVTIVISGDDAQLKAG